MSGVTQSVLIAVVILGTLAILVALGMAAVRREERELWNDAHEAAVRAGCEPDEAVQRADAAVDEWLDPGLWG